MAKGVTDSRYYAGIAAAIRAKNGEDTVYKPNEMTAAILDIEGGNGKKIYEVNIYESIGTALIVFDDSSMATVNATFDADGLPTSLTDDNGSVVNFVDGYPTSATDKDGNVVPIVWG